MFCTPRSTPVAQMLAAGELESMPMLANIEKYEYVIASQRTELSGAALPVQKQKPISTELCIGRQPIIHGHPSVIIGCNPLRFPESLGTANTRSRSQIPQYVLLRDA